MLDNKQGGERASGSSRFAQDLNDLGMPLEEVLQELAHRIQQGGSAGQEALLALAEVASYFDLKSEDSLMQKVESYARHGEKPIVRRAALDVLGAIRPKAATSNAAEADLWRSVLQHDADEGCRVAAIGSIIRKACVDATSDALVASLTDVRVVRLAALEALSKATPTVPLVHTLTQVLVKHHDDQETVAFGLASLCILISRGFRLTDEWRTIVARVLATVTEFFPPSAAVPVAVAHAKAIRWNAATADEAISELVHEFNQRRFSAAAEAYAIEIQLLMLLND